jgi:purine-cytosine permease-like protein
MNLIKRCLGVFWIILGSALVLYFPYQTYSVITSQTSTSEDYVFWMVVTGIFIPVIFGLLLFGYYAVRGEYDLTVASHRDITEIPRETEDVLKEI